MRVMTYEPETVAFGTVPDYGFFTLDQLPIEDGTICQKVGFSEYINFSTKERKRHQINDISNQVYQLEVVAMAVRPT